MNFRRKTDFVYYTVDIFFQKSFGFYNFFKKILKKVSRDAINCNRIVLIQLSKKSSNINREDLTTSFLQKSKKLSLTKNVETL